LAEFLKFAHVIWNDLAPCGASSFSQVTYPVGQVQEGVLVWGVPLGLTRFRGVVVGPVVLGSVPFFDVALLLLVTISIAVSLSG